MNDVNLWLFNLSRQRFFKLSNDGTELYYGNTLIVKVRSRKSLWFSAYLSIDMSLGKVNKLLDNQLPRVVLGNFEPTVESFSKTNRGLLLSKRYYANLYAVPDGYLVESNFKHLEADSIDGVLYVLRKVDWSYMSDCLKEANVK